MYFCGCRDRDIFYIAQNLKKLMTKTKTVWRHTPTVLRILSTTIKKIRRQSEKKARVPSALLLGNNSGKPSEISK
jgi:hypothetical protein